MRSLLEFLSDVLRGPRCPVCWERHRAIGVHVRFQHRDEDWPL